MELLQSILENSKFPILSSFILGLMTAISPCPLATNITAIGFIGKEIESKKRVFYNGLIYTLGRAISYTTLGLLFYLGAEQIKIERFFSVWGEKVIGPLLIVIGLFLLGVFNFIKLPFEGSIMSRFEERFKGGFWGVLLMGVIFALAFCPYSGVLYFGMLIPMTISSNAGMLLPPVFSIATGIPVIVFAWLVAFSVGSIGNWYNKTKTFEKWFRKIVAILFIGAGTYYLLARMNAI